MNVTHETLDQIETHWAIEAIGPERRNRAFSVAEFRLVNASVGSQIHINFNQKENDLELIERTATAYELAAVEGIDALLHPGLKQENKKMQAQAMAGAYRAFELRRVLPVPTEDTERVFHIFHMASLAYCGDRWPDLRRWLKENADAVHTPSFADVEWDYRVLFRLFDCWIRLFRKDRWDDLDGIRLIIAGLREDQKRYETDLLENDHNKNNPALAYRLISLYHWAKATELLAVYMLQGDPPSVTTELDKHFEAGHKASLSCGDASLEVILRWLHVASRKMVEASVWWVAQAVNSRVTKFITRATRSRSLFELLPPQRVALQEQGLLDQANRAVVVNLPTSGGKTILAQFRILQALNQFDADQGWVAYVAPTRALVAQVTRRLRSDFEPMGINVEQLSAAVEIDGCEEALLGTAESIKSFHILVTTPEKLSLVIRNKAVSRPLALLVLDEAHNIEDKERGLRIELLLATVKRDCPMANFLLLMPFVPNADELSKWLADERGKTISIGTSAWLPNERIIGLFDIRKDAEVRSGWSLDFETLTTTPKTIQLKGRHQAGTVKPLNISYSKAKSFTNMTGAMAKIFSDKGTSIAIARRITDAWSMARNITKSLPALDKGSPDIELVQRFLATEISPEFELINMLGHGVGVHHAGLSEETRSLVEWLAETGKLRVLCATTTIAQGINFPVSSVFLSSIFVASRKGDKMPNRSFWNLAGRAGRIDHDSVGVIGIAAGKNPVEIKKYVKEATGDLISRLVTLLNEIEQTGFEDLSLAIEKEEWTDLRSYVAHLWNEKRRLDAVLSETEQLLRNTFGYGILKSGNSAKDQKKASALLAATRQYAEKLSDHPENAVLADATGFCPEGVRSALLGLNKLENKLTPADWEPSSLFASGKNSVLPQLVGIMMQIPQIRSSLEEIKSKGPAQKHIASITREWVMGSGIEEIAKKYFSATSKSDSALTDSITAACKGIYKTLANVGTWGISALSKMPTSGLDFEKLSADERRTLNNLPAMIYHGVNTESAVLMRINSVPRSIAPNLGERFASTERDKEDRRNVRKAREFLRSLSVSEWQEAVPKGAKMTGGDYREVWLRLAGEVV